MTETIEKVNALPVKIIFVEPQYSPKTADTISRETGATVATLDPIVTGDATPASADDYLNKMRLNMNVLSTELNR